MKSYEFMSFTTVEKKSQTVAKINYTIKRIWKRPT
jgi:hypothetical protein